MTYRPSLTVRIAAGAALLIAILIGCTIVLLKSSAPAPTYSLFDPRVSVGETSALISYGDGGPENTVTVPLPEGYCFADETHPAERDLVQVMKDMQASYGSVLWLAFVNCAQSKTVRLTQTADTYMDSGMVIISYAYADRKISAQAYTSVLRRQIEELNPQSFEEMLNDAAKDNITPSTQIKSGQPIILQDNPDDLIFMMTHELADATTQAFRLTEFDAATAIKERALVTVFTYKNLDDPKPKSEFIKAYLEQLRAAND